MQKFILSIGLNDKNTLSQVIPTSKAIRIVSNEALIYVGGCTTYKATCVYTHNDGSTIESVKVLLPCVTAYGCMTYQQKRKV